MISQLYIRQEKKYIINESKAITFYNTKIYKIAFASIVDLHGQIKHLNKFGTCIKAF